MIEQVNLKNLPPCWREVENHPDMVKLIPGVERTEKCIFRVKQEIPWADRTKIAFGCAHPKAVFIEQETGNHTLTATNDPATFCEPYDLYRRGMGEKSLLIIDLQATPVHKMLNRGNSDKT